MASLSVPDEKALIDLANTLRKNKLKYHMFSEPDIGDQFTALVIEPSVLSSKLCSNLPLALKGLGKQQKIYEAL